MDDTTIEALREVLQDMTTAIELLSSGERSGTALIHFIEEMLKTIESWALKYNVFLDDGSLAVNSAHGSEVNPASHSFPDTDHQAEEAVDTINFGHAVTETPADPLTRPHPIAGEAVQRSIVSPNKGLAACNAESRGDHLVHSQNDGMERQAVPSRGDHSSEIILSTGRRKTRSQASSMFADVTSTDDGEAKVHSTHSEKDAKSGKAVLGNEPLTSKGDVIASPTWLPDGWITEVKSGTTSNVGSKNKVYVDPTLKHCFQSKKEVLAFLGTTKRKRGRPRKTESFNDVSSGHANDTAQVGSIDELVVGLNPDVQLPSKPSPSNIIASQLTSVVSAGVDTTKRKRGRPRKVDSATNLAQTKEEHSNAEHTNVSDQAGDTSESLVSSKNEAQVPVSTDALPHAAASSLPTSSSSIPLPLQSGQPSEWLVYESLASLPFPMFEHLRFVENNANKLATNSSPPTLWPWMLSNSEDLKKLFTDIKSKPVEESKQEEAVPASFAKRIEISEVVPKRAKKAARKNAS